MEDLAVRKAVPEDSEEIASLWRDGLGYDCTDEMVRAGLERLDHSREEVFAAEKEGRIAGVIHMERYALLYSELMANVLGLAVEESCRRQGVGTALLQAGEDWAREIGAVKIRLTSGAERTEAHSFYRSRGFEQKKLQINFSKSL